MKITTSTSITSTSGVTLMGVDQFFRPDGGSCDRMPRRHPYEASTPNWACRSRAKPSSTASSWLAEHFPSRL